jgi:hypothetical protein
MRMSVLQIMEIDRAVNVLKTHEKTDRRLLVDPLETNPHNATSIYQINTADDVNSTTADRTIKPCRDCPEGMEW